MSGKPLAAGPLIMNKKTVKKRAVVLLSGGLDSAVTLYLAREQGYELFALSFDYGQRHKKELVLAEKLARRAGAKWHKVKFSLPWKGSALLDKKVKIPDKGKFGPRIPVTYVPARNIIFLSFAASYAEVAGAQAIFIGANQIDYSGYPDCRDEFLSLFEQTLKKGTKTGAGGKTIRICAPLLNKNKAGIVKTGSKLKVPFGLTWSCYAGRARPCGTCDSCRLRRQGFAAAGIKDPVL